MVFQRANDAAECALALQAALSRLDFAALGLSVPLSLRIGGHLGPVYETLDPVLGHTNFFGARHPRRPHRAGHAAGLRLRDRRPSRRRWRSSTARPLHATMSA